MNRLSVSAFAFALFIVMCSCSSQNTHQTNTGSVSSIDSSSSISASYIGDCYYAEQRLTIEEITERATHIVYAVRNGLRIDIKGETVEFDFTVFDVVKGEMVQNTNLDGKKICRITVVGSVDDYTLKNVYSQGNVYILWLEQYVHDETTPHFEHKYRYRDLLRKSLPVNAFRLTMPYEAPMEGSEFDTFIESVLNLDENVLIEIKEFEEIFSAWEEKNRQNESESNSTSDCYASDTPSPNE